MPWSSRCAGGRSGQTGSGDAGGAEGSVEAAERGSKDDPAEAAGVVGPCGQATEVAISRIRGIVDARREEGGPGHARELGDGGLRDGQLEEAADLILAVEP